MARGYSLCVESQVAQSKDGHRPTGRGEEQPADLEDHESCGEEGRGARRRLTHRQEPSATEEATNDQADGTPAAPNVSSGSLSALLMSRGGADVSVCDAPGSGRQGAGSTVLGPPADVGAAVVHLGKPPTAGSPTILGTLCWDGVGLT